MRSSVFPSHDYLHQLMKSVQSQIGRYLHLTSHTRLYSLQFDRDNQILLHQIPRHKSGRTEAEFWGKRCCLSAQGIHDFFSSGGRPASARSRSYRSDPQRIKGRLPGEPKALAPTSNRKAPQEGHHISLVDSRAKRRKNQRQQRQTMNDSEQWKKHRAFGAVEWGSDKHSVRVRAPSPKQTACALQPPYGLYRFFARTAQVIPTYGLSAEKSGEAQRFVVSKRTIFYKPRSARFNFSGSQANRIQGQSHQWNRTLLQHWSSASDGCIQGSGSESRRTMSNAHLAVGSTSSTLRTGIQFTPLFATR